MSNYKYFCPRCKTSGKGSNWTCGVHGHDKDYMSCTRTRYPSKSVSKTRWKDFVKHLKSHWIYENGNSKFADEFRRKISILEDNI